MKSKAFDRIPATTIAESAWVEPGAYVGDRVAIWHHSVIRTGAEIHNDASVGSFCYVDHDVYIGPGSRLQNGAQVFYGARVGTGVFIGPYAVIANVLRPRALHPKKHKIRADQTLLDHSCSIGAHAVILPGVKIGAYAMVGAGAVVSRDVEPYELVVGHNEKGGYVCRCGYQRVDRREHLGCECMPPEAPAS